MIKRNSIIKRNIELWKSIEGFSDYEVSNMGRVKSLERFVKFGSSTRHIRESILNPTRDKGGYHIVSFHPQKRKVHSLVIGHFGGPKPSHKHECNHIDGIKSNNWDTNLEWLTHKQNMEHAYSAGLINSIGEKNGSAKLIESDIKKIRKMYKTGKYSSIQLGKKFNVSKSCIGFIINHETWQHVK